MTKETLTQKNGALSAQVDSLNARDAVLRDRFSKVLNAPNERDNPFASRSSRATYSWEEIFFEIGKLMPETDKVNIRRFDSTLDILLEKLANQGRRLNAPNEPELP